MEIKNIEEKRPRGRPPGAVVPEDPASMIRVDLGQTLKLQKKVRGVIESELNKMEERLDDTEHPLPLRERLECIETLARAMDTLTKSVQQTAGFITKVKMEEGKSELSDEEMLERLVGGK